METRGGGGTGALPEPDRWSAWGGHVTDSPGNLSLRSLWSPPNGPDTTFPDRFGMESVTNPGLTHPRNSASSSASRSGVSPDRSSRRSASWALNHSSVSRAVCSSGRISNPAANALSPFTCIMPR